MKFINTITVRVTIWIMGTTNTTIKLTTRIMTIIMTKHMMTYEERNSDEIALPASSITANNNITITPSMYGRIFLRVREMFHCSYA